MQNSHRAHLGGSSPVDDGLDEDAEVGVVLLGAVPLDADAKAGRTRVAKRDLEGQELPRPVRGQNQLVFLHLGLQEEREEELQSAESSVGSRSSKTAGSQQIAVAANFLQKRGGKFNHSNLEKKEKKNICEASQKAPRG